MSPHPPFGHPLRSRRGPIGMSVRTVGAIINRQQKQNRTDCYHSPDGDTQNYNGRIIFAPTRGTHNYFSPHPSSTVPLPLGKHGRLTRFVVTSSVSLAPAPSKICLRRLSITPLLLLSPKSLSDFSGTPYTLLPVSSSHRLAASSTGRASAVVRVQDIGK